MKTWHKQANKMFCVSFVLMKLKSHFIGFSDERSLQRRSVKNTRAFHSLPLHGATSYFSCKYLRLFPVKIACQLLVPTRECRRKRLFASVLAKNHVFKRKQDGRRLENQTPRTEKLSSKFKLNAACQNYSYKKNNILQNNKSCHQQSTRLFEE